MGTLEQCIASWANAKSLERVQASILFVDPTILWLQSLSLQVGLHKEVITIVFDYVLELAEMHHIASLKSKFLQDMRKRVDTLLLECEQAARSGQVRVNSRIALFDLDEASLTTELKCLTSTTSCPENLDLLATSWKLLLSDVSPPPWFESIFAGLPNMSLRQIVNGFGANVRNAYMNTDSQIRDRMLPLCKNLDRNAFKLLNLDVESMPIDMWHCARKFLLKYVEDNPQSRGRYRIASLCEDMGQREDLLMATMHDVC